MTLEEKIELKERKREIKNLKRQIRKIRFKEGLCGVTFAGVVLGATVAPSAIATLICVSDNHSPFKRDVTTKEAHVKTEFNSKDGEVITKQYDQYEDEKNELRYHTGWEKTPEDDYISNVITYDASNLTYYDVEQIVKGEKKLSAPIEEKTLRKDYVSENIFSEDSYYEGVIYETDNNDCIEIVQSKDENATDIARCVSPVIFGFLMGEVAFLLLREDVKDSLKDAETERKSLVKTLGMKKQL